MPECVKSEIKLFADDSLLYRRIQNNADFCQLQEDLDKLQEWEQKWQMAFNAEKCEVIRITNKKGPLCSDYFIHNQKLALRTEAKYLGVTIGSDLSWSRHADNITKKANSTLGFLKTNIRSAPQAAKETAYKTARPIVEYAATTWNQQAWHGPAKGSAICVKWLLTHQQCHRDDINPWLGHSAEA